jgi:hypothetical protein
MVELPTSLRGLAGRLVEPLDHAGPFEERQRHVRRDLEEVVAERVTVAPVAGRRHHGQAQHVPVETHRALHVARDHRQVIDASDSHGRLL